MTESAKAQKKPAALGVRWPLYLQLLLPMVPVVLLVALLATAITTSWIAYSVRRRQEEHANRIAHTVADASFPLTARVLNQLRDLSGAEFVVWEIPKRIVESTMAIEPGTSTTLAEWAAREPAGRTRFEERLGDHAYLVDRVKMSSKAALGRPRTLFILHPKAALALRVYEAILPALCAGAVATILALAVAAWLARRWVRPLHTVVRQTARIAEGDFAPMPLTRTNDELHDLSASVNRMAERLKHYEEEVRRSERLRTLGQLGAAMAHQLRNAATGGRLAIEWHQRECGQNDEALTVALRQLQLMESYLQRFLGLGRNTPQPREPVAIAQLVDEVLGLLRPVSQHTGVAIHAAGDCPPLVLCADAEAVRQLLANLVGNAIEAAQAVPNRAGEVSIIFDQPDATTGVVEVCDNGEGPPAVIRDRLFEPFASAKASGIGLGLWVARQIAEAHGGSLTWRRDDGLTKFRFAFPHKGE